jgi:hypothetical protein
MIADTVTLFPFGTPSKQTKTYITLGDYDEIFHFSR